MVISEKYIITHKSDQRVRNNQKRLVVVHAQWKSNESSRAVACRSPCVWTFPCDVQKLVSSKPRHSLIQFYTVGDYLLSLMLSISICVNSVEMQDTLIQWSGRPATRRHKWAWSVCWVRPTVSTCSQEKNDRGDQLSNGATRHRTCHPSLIAKDLQNRTITQKAGLVTTSRWPDSTTGVTTTSTSTSTPPWKAPWERRPRNRGHC